MRLILLGLVLLALAGAWAVACILAAWANG